jgi:hypothetical protein
MGTLEADSMQRHPKELIMPPRPPETEHASDADDLRHAMESCVGYRVRSPHGHLGFVEDVEYDAAAGGPGALAVRTGRLLVLGVPAAEVGEIRLEERVVVLGSRATQFAFGAGDRILLRPSPDAERSEAA